MAFVTVQVLEGLERGRIYRDLVTPVTIGREDENTIQLNDERVSRFHAKLQEDGAEAIILTDLQSTNGTRVNGHPTQLRVLRPGDQVTIGRCLLLFGSDSEIEARATESPTPAVSAGAPLGTVSRPQEEDDLRELFPSGAPQLPQHLTAVQRARMADVLSYAHDQIRKVLVDAQDDAGGKVTAEWKTWQQLVHLEKQLAVYLRRIVEPDDDTAQSS